MESGERRHVPTRWKQRKVLPHEVPHWVDTDSEHPTFFITVCCQQRHKNQLAVDSIWKEMLETIENREERGLWVCPLFLAMPDHVHAIMRFEGEKRMKLVMRQWKRWIASELGIDWQRDFFDHRLRTESSAIEKRNYILQNPVRGGLVERPEDWKYVRDVRRELER